MLIDRPQIVEGSAIQNATVPSGTAFPSLPSLGELFYLTTGTVGLYSYNGSTWEVVAKGAVLAAHMADDTRHLTASQNTLLDGITASSADINSIPAITGRVNTVESTLADHIVDEARHLSPSQNAFLDGLNLPALTAAHVNFLQGVTANIQAQFNAITSVNSQQSTDIAALQSSSGTGQNSLQQQLDTHKADDTRHLTPTQNTLLDGITVDFTQINKLAGLATYLGGTSLAAQLSTFDNAKLNANGSNSMTGNLNLGGNRIVNVASPTLASDAVNKDYVDSFVQGIHWVNSARVTTSQNISLSGLQTIDSVAVAVNDRVLVKNQNVAAQNGIWVAASGAWSRANDYNTPQEINNSAVFVLEGVQNGKSTWVQLSSVNVLNTDPITWTAFSGPVVNSAGPGISLGASGMVSVVEGAGLAFNGNALIVDLHTAGGLILTTDNAGVSSAAGAQLALGNVGTPGTYRSVTTDAKGRVTAGSNPVITIPQGGHGETTAAAGLNALGGYPKTGGLISGDLRVSGATVLGQGGVGPYNGYASALTVNFTGSGSEYGITMRPMSSTQHSNAITFLASTTTATTAVDFAAIQLMANNAGMNLAGPWFHGMSRIVTATSGNFYDHVTINEGKDLRLQSGAAGDIGDIIFVNPNGTEKHRLYDGGTNLYYRYDTGTGYGLWHQGNLTNLNQLTNGPGYITKDIDGPMIIRGTDSGMILQSRNTTANAAPYQFYIQHNLGQVTIGNERGSIQLNGNASTATSATSATNATNAGFATKAGGATDTFAISGVSPTISFIDTDAGKTRYIYHNDGFIGFLNSSGGWAERVGDDGIVIANGFSGDGSRLTGVTVASAPKLTGQAYTNGTDGWFRSQGATGWYNETYSVGVYATEAGNVRTYNGASFVASNVYATGRFIAVAGSAAAPTYSFNHDGDTGLYSEGDGYLNISVNGAYRGRFDGAGNLGITGTFYGAGGGLTGFAASLTSGYADNLNWSALQRRYTWGGIQTFLANKGWNVYGANTNDLTMFYSDDGGCAGFSFHRGAGYAVNMTLDPDNVIRIGGWSAAANRFQFDMAGNFTAAGDVVAFSDARLKKDVKIIESAGEKVSKLNGVTFTRIEDETQGTGLIAQDVQAVLPEAVHENGDGTLGVAYGNLVGLLVEAIKELQAEVKELKANQKT